MKPMVAIVGRPNVGKSTLFNRILSARAAIVESEPGVTRDRIYADAEWSGRGFILVDTGGLEAPPSAYSDLVRDQAKTAIDEADLIIFLVDARTGFVPDDEIIADMLRRSKKQVLLVVNKAETGELRQQSHEFFALGLGTPHTISAAHGLQVGDLLDEVLSRLPETPEADDEAETEWRLPLAVIGRPNAGKSTLVNSLFGSARMITSDVPGTTRDAVDVDLEFEGKALTLIDTAGLRRPSRIEPGLDRWSTLRALRAVQRCEVVLLMIDSTREITEQEQRLARYAADAGRGLVIALNKIDLLERSAGAVNELLDRARNDLHFVSWAPQIAVSAKTGEHLARLVRAALRVAESRRQRIPREDLQALVSDACLLRPPGSYRGRPVACNGAEQLPGLPPAFAVYFNWPQAVAGSYLRFIENRLREAYDFTGTPLTVLSRRGRPGQEKPAAVRRRPQPGR
jgi:GTP-binding protein